MVVAVLSDMASSALAFGHSQSQSYQPSQHLVNQSLWFHPGRCSVGTDQSWGPFGFIVGVGVYTLDSKVGI